MVLQKSDNECRGFLRCLGPGNSPEMEAGSAEILRCEAHRHLQRGHGGVCTIEDNDLQEIVGTTLSIQGIENALGVCTVRADDHDDRESRMRALLHDVGLSKTGLKSRQERLKR